MKSFVLALAVLCTVSWSNAYSAYSRSSISSSSSSSPGNCCNLSPWAYANIDTVRKVADRLRQDYNARSRGGGYSGRYTTQTWGDSVVNSIGKSKEELDSLCRQISDQIISDMQLGRVNYGVVAQPNYFESQAATALEKLVEGSDYVDNQQHQVELYEPIAPQIGGTDLSKLDQVQTVNYPTEVKVVNGQTYITNKNFTSGVIRSGPFNNPTVTTVRVNRTTTHTTVPLYVSQGPVISRPFVNNQEHRIYDHLSKQEIGVPNYSPEVTVDDSLVVGMNQNAYTPSVVIPVEGGDQVDTFGNVNQYLIPGHTVTIKKYNRTIITGPDGVPIVTGSKSESVWDNGILVYNSNVPFGSVQWTKDDLWKREERERLFWLFQKGAITIRELEEWQRNQEDRLSALAYRSNKSLEEIQDWQRQELERYKILVNQYNTRNPDLTEWQKSERGRLDWLIHQNGITREELERWQRENLQKLNVLARQYRISIEELKEYQRQELERLYMIFNSQNTEIGNKLVYFKRQESDRLNNILLQHNITVDQLKEQIRHDQDRYKDLSEQYRLNVGDLEKFYKSELSRLTDVINKQQEEMKRITDWQLSERSRLEDIIRHHNFTVEELEQKMKQDRNYLTGLAQKYHISLEDLEKWQRSELDRLHEVGKVNLQNELQVWQQQERDRMLAIIKKNDLTIEEYEAKIGNDRARLQQLSSMYQVQVEEIEKWLKEEAQRLKNEGVFSDVQKNLTQWQKQERDRLQAIVQNNEVTIEDLQNKIKNDQTRLYGLAQTYQIRVEEIEDWLKKELLRLQSQGLVKKEDLEEWQKTERQKLLVFVQGNKLSVEDFEKLLLNDRNRLQQLATQYHVELKDIESWLRKESERLQNLGLIEQEKLTEWQKIERERLLTLLHHNELSIDELEKKIKSDHVHIYALAHQYSVRVEEIEEWLKNEVLRLQNQALADTANLKDWQKIERERLMKLVNHNDLTIDEFTQKLKADRAYLQQLAMQHHVEIEEVEEWVKNEGNRLEILGLIKPNAPLTQWQEVEREHLLSIVQEQGPGPEHDQWTLDELEERLKNDRAHLAGVAQQYKVQVQEIEEWIKKEIQRLQNQGLVQIEQLTNWQLAERDRLNALIAQQQSGSSVDEIEKKLRADRRRLQDLATQNNVHVKEIEEWIHKELERMKNQGKLQIENLTDWQRKERDRLLVFVQQQSDLTAAELEQKLQNDRSRLQGLAYQYHVEVKDVEEWIRKEIQRLRDQGKLHIENLTSWQLGERDRLQHLIQQQAHLSVEEVEKQLKADHNRLQQLALQYHIQLEEVEEWIRKEAQRLRNQGELHIVNLTDWQKNERLRIQQLILQNNNLTAEEVENQLKADRNQLQQLAWQHHIQVADIEAWIKKEVQRLRDEGKLEIEKLAAWQNTERDRLLQLAKQQSKLTSDEFERKLINDRKRLEALAIQYHVSVQEIEEWIKREAERLENQGIIGDLKDWQRVERLRIQDLIKQNNLTIDELKEQLKKDHNRLQQLALQYHVTVEEVEEWILKEGNRQIKPEALTVWQTNELERIREQIKQQPGLTIEQWEEQLKSDRNRLQQLAWQYHVTVNEVEEWIRKEGEKWIKPESLTLWQLNELERLRQEIKQRPDLTIEDWDQEIQDDRSRLEELAWNYQTTVEVIEEWLRNEGRRVIKPQPLKEWQKTERQWILQQIQQPHGLTIDELEAQLKSNRYRLQQVAQRYHVAIEEIEEWIRKEGNRLIKPIQLNEWQRNEHDRLLQIIKQNDLTIEELRQKLKADRPRLQQLAYQYHVTVEEVEEWIVNEGKKLIKPVQLKVWQQNERDRYLLLIKQNDLTIEELRQKLQADRARLQQLASQYHVTIEEIEEWIVNEGRKVTHSAPLTDWQLNERVRLLLLIKQNDLTIEELRQKLNADRARLQQLAYQYHVTVEEVEEWIVNEGKKLIKPGQLTVWQQNERDRYLPLIKQNDLTIEELRQKLQDDRARLQQLASQYHVTIEEIEEWIVNEGRKVTHSAPLTDWQLNERVRLLLLIKQNDLTIEELRQKLNADRARLQQLANQYHVTVEEVEEWIVNEGKKLIEPGQLTVWQQNERDRYLPLIKQNDLTIEELRQKLQADRARLQQLASQYHVTIEEIEEWIVNEGRKVTHSAPLTDWQLNERVRLLLLIKQNDLTIEELRQKLNADRARLQQLANQYHVTVEEVEEWIINEGKKLIKPGQLTVWQQNERDRYLLLIKQNDLTIEELRQKLQADRARLQQLAYQYHITVEEIEEWIINDAKKIIKPVSNGELKQWQQHEREYLIALTQTNLVTLKNFEKHLSEDQQRLENVANHYQISVDEIIQFLRQEVQRLAGLKLISEGEDEIQQVPQWQNGEQQYILQLLLESNFSIEELERKLRDDTAHLQQLANQYRITIDQIKEWYRIELQKLLQQKKIYSENLTDWQKREKERIYLTIKQQDITIEELLQQLTRDRDALGRLAAQYHITIEELIEWQRKELDRLSNLGFLRKPGYDSLTAWQILEKKRLRAIPVKVTITMEELITFLTSDTNFNANLTSHYEVSLEELKAFQLHELQNMKDEGVLEILTLKHLEEWQRRELDRLYGLIRHQNFALKDLKKWQKRDRLVSIASIYRIPYEILKEWQAQEMERLEEIAKHYKITLNHLEDFRRGEIQRLEFAAHQGALSESEIQIWIAAEEARLNALRTRTGLSGLKLDKWRRKLYLLSQDLIDLGFNEGGYGGIELETHTSVSGKRNETISKDRGDQPPQLYQEEFEESEPSIGSSWDHNAPMVQVPERPGHGQHGRWPHRHGPPHGGPGHGYGPQHYLPPPPGPPFGRGPPHRGHDERTESERIHSKKEYSFTVPVDVPAPEPTQGHGYQNRYSHGRGPFSGKMLIDSQTQNDQEDDLGQQQVQVEDWNSYSDTQKSEKIEDIGQQQQIELDLDQQQVQNENLEAVQLAGGSSSSSSSSSSSASSQSGSQIDGQAAEETIVNAESVTDQPKTVWGKIKTSAKSWFG